MRSFDEMDTSYGRDVEISVNDRHVMVDVDSSLRGKNVEIVVDGEAVFMGSVSRSGSIKLLRGTEPAEKLLGHGERAENSQPLDF